MTRLTLTGVDVRAVHDVVAEHPATEPGLRDAGALNAALGTVPPSADPTRGEVALYRCRLPVANHPFADGNNRTGLRMPAVTFELDGHRLPYGPNLESLVRLFSVDAEIVAPDRVAAYLDRRADAGGMVPVSAATLDDSEARTAWIRERTREDIEAHRDLYDRLAGS